jgi:hypothetical protein
MADALGRPSVLRGSLGSWVALWTTAIVVGALSGILIWLIGGWWFRMRLRFSGARNADPLSVRLVYVHACSSLAIPTIALLLILVPRYSSFEQAQSDQSFALTGLVLPFWSIYLILPSGLLAMFLVLMFVSGLASTWGTF